MRAIPFIDIPVVKVETPSIVQRREDLVEWAEGEKIKLSAAFLCFENEGEDFDDYLYQIGFISNNCLVTTEWVIEELGIELSKGDVFHLAKRHLELYFDKINSIPTWGTNEFEELKREGRTPRVLEGPHKRGKLKPNERREIIISREGEIIFGPLLK
jgi:hypothetical protein